jgi:hypothetical protein
MEAVPSAWEALRSRFRSRKGGGDGLHAVPGLFTILSRVSALSSITAKEQHKIQADLFIKVPVAGFRMFAWERVDELIELGYRVGMEAIESWDRTDAASPPAHHE